MFLDDQIRRLEEETAMLDAVVRLTGAVLAELVRTKPAQPRLDQVQGLLRAARERAAGGDTAGGEKLLEQAGDALVHARQLLAVSDLGVSPFALRSHLERKSLPRPEQRALIRYLLSKEVHAENDRDKLDYLLTAHFRSESGPAPSEDLESACAVLCEGLNPSPLRQSDEVMRHELQSLIARVDDFSEFDQLVQARMVERVRALKTNLGGAFFHPRILPTLIRFNLAFRHRFDQLFDAQVAAARRETRRRLDEAWELVRQVESAYESLAFPEGAERVGAPIIPEAGGTAARVGRLDAPDERPALDRLMRPADTHLREKESELRGIIGRLARYVEKLPREQMTADKVVFPLRHAQLELVRWEREAFAPSSVAVAPESARCVQTALGIVAWIEEELAQYNQCRDQRYLWKPHFDALSHAVARSVELLSAVRGLLRPDAPEEEAAWFGPLLHTSVRLGIALNHANPVFEEAPA
ncbi:MAG: hypothetical protein L0212_09715 [Acidobacteria bacterium]|nr:hypothetical protein [Acidobacteriota bacterium]